VEISSVWPESPTSFRSYGQVAIRAAWYGEGAPRLDVTGWSIRARSGGYFIPGAVGFYDAAGLAPETAITLGSNEYLYIYSTTGPVGKNLRINKCLGYLQNFKDADPGLPYYTCPAFYRDQSELSHLSGVCQDYITSLWGCQLPEDVPPVPRDDYECLEFLDTWNYKGCVEKYRSDSDFLSQEWWVWSGRGSLSFLDERHDRVLLLDQNGLLVDEYIY
jgi:hypothetical protein